MHVISDTSQDLIAACKKESIRKIFYKQSVLSFQAKCTSSEEDAKLHVDKAERGDTGKYTITVTNESGSMSADVNVIVLGE